MAEQPADCVVQVTLTFSKRLCLDMVILQTDGEPAIVELAEAVAKARPQTVAWKTPAHSSQSRGTVESCVGHLAGQLRTTRAQLEVTHGVTTSPNCASGFGGRDVLAGLRAGSRLGLRGARRTRRPLTASGKVTCSSAPRYSGKDPGVGFKAVLRVTSTPAILVRFRPLVRRRVPS